MAWRIVGGLSGWLMSLAPLVIVNVLALVTAINPGLVPIAGGAGLGLGIALGGLTAGLLGARRGGAGWGGSIAGAIAAALVAGTLIAIMYGLRAQHQLPYLLALHPIRAMGAIGFIACLVMGVAALVGALSGRRQAHRAELTTQAALAARPARVPSGQRPAGPTSQPYAHPERPSQRNPRDSRYPAESHTRERSSRW